MPPGKYPLLSFPRITENKCSHLGPNKVYLTVTDIHGNIGGCSALVTVINIDTDADGILDCDDNCPLIRNPNQSDSDQDGIGNVCDPCNNNQGGGRCDDGDPCTIGDTLDSECNCAGIAQDSDGDGILDGCDDCYGNNVTGDAIVRVIEESGRADSLVGVAVDSDPVEIEGMRNGYLDALVVQTPYDQAYNAVMNAVKHIVNGEEFEDAVNMPASVVTPENMDDPDMAALLDPTILAREE